MIKETCACGATFEIATSWYTDATTAAAAWREDHKHEMPAPEVKALHGDSTGGVWCGGCRQQLYLSIGGDLRHLSDGSPACGGDDDGRTDRPAGST